MTSGAASGGAAAACPGLWETEAAGSQTAERGSAVHTSLLSVSHSPELWSKRVPASPLDHKVTKGITGNGSDDKVRRGKCYRPLWTFTMHQGTLMAQGKLGIFKKSTNDFY